MIEERNEESTVQMIHSLHAPVSQRQRQASGAELLLRLKSRQAGSQPRLHTLAPCLLQTSAEIKGCRQRQMSFAPPLAHLPLNPISRRPLRHLQGLRLARKLRHIDGETLNGLGSLSNARGDLSLGVVLAELGDCHMGQTSLPLSNPS